MFKNAKVGDRVWSWSYGWGTINNIEPGETYLIFVDFDGDEGSESFTFDGKIYEDDKRPDLYWDEIKITPPAKPKRRVKKSIIGYVNIYPNDFDHVLHKTEDGAKSSAGLSVIAVAVPVHGEYEVEEED